MTSPSGDQPASFPTQTVFDVPLSTFVELVAVALGAMAMLAVIRQAPSEITMVAVGILIALALDPVVVRIHQRMSWRRGTAVAVVGVALGLGLGGVLLVLGPAAIDEASSLRRDLPATIEETYSWPIVGDTLAERDFANEVDDAIDRLPARLGDAQIRRFAEDLLGGLVTTLVVLITAVAVMLDGETIVTRLRNSIPDRQRAQVESVGRVVYRTFGNYFAGSLFVAILNGLVILATALALGVPLAPLAGLWSTLTNLIPQIGGFLGGSFLVVLALTESPTTAVIALVVFLVYQNVENNVIQPAVVGRAVNLSPPTTMLAALVGGAIAGVPGALVATPILGAAKVLVLRDDADGRIDGKGIGAPTGAEIDGTEGAPPSDDEGPGQTDT